MTLMEWMDAFDVLFDINFYNKFLSYSFQMVQAIQVLRFHLLELEKVSVNMNY